MLDKLGNSRETRQKIVIWKSLCLVKDDDAVCDVVQLSAFAAAVGVERFKKLNCGGNDDGQKSYFPARRFCNQHLKNVPEHFPRPEAWRR